MLSKKPPSKDVPGAGRAASDVASALNTFIEKLRKLNSDWGCCVTCYAIYEVLKLNTTVSARSMRSISAKIKAPAFSNDQQRVRGFHQLSAKGHIDGFISESCAAAEDAYAAAASASSPSACSSS